MLQLFFNLIIFISTPLFAAEKINDWTCEQLIEKSKDEKFVLASLAGLRAHKKCDNFKYDWRNLSSVDKRLYVDELLDIDPEAQKPTAEIPVDDLLKKLKTEKDPVAKFKLYKLIRQKYRNNGKRDESQKMAKQMYQWTQKNWKADKKNTLAKSQYFEAGISQARLLWNTDKVKESLDLLKKLNSEFKDENLADSHFLNGKIFEEQEKFELAIEQYEKALTALKKGGSSLSPNIDALKLSWTKSWLYYRTEAWALAEASFKDLSDSTTDVTEKSRAEFFRARVLQKLNKSEEAKLVLKSIIENDFYSYYALASYHLLGEKLPPLTKMKKSTDFVIDPKLSFLDESSKKLIDALIKYEEFEIVEKAVPIFSKNLDQNVNLSLYLAEESKRYLPLFSSFAKLSNTAKLNLLQTKPELVFPRPFESEVKAMAEKTELPSSLIYSIMKQESGFNLNSRSHADAFGLMQLIPRLAKSLAKKFDVPYKNPEDLYKPEINIPLGSYELREQIKKQKGQMTFVAAAYNAGPNALARWLKNRKSTDDIFDFVESIPYDETRMYVKIIARNKLFYDRTEKPDQPTSFPVEFVAEAITENTSILNQ